MKEVKRVLVVALMSVILSGGSLMHMAAFGQKNNDNRPPKEPEKIKEPQKPPPSNSNSQGNSNRRRP